MAGQHPDWNFDGLDVFDNLQARDAIWAGFDAYEGEDLGGEHWSSDTWNEPHPEPHADHDHSHGHDATLGQAPLHYYTSHAQLPLNLDVNNNNNNNNEHPHFEPTNPPITAVPFGRYDLQPNPNSQSEASYRRPSRDLPSPNHSASFTSHTEHGTDPAALRHHPIHEPQARNYQLNHNVPDNSNSQVIASDSDNDDTMPRPRRTGNSDPVDLTTSPNMPAAKTRKRRSSGTGAGDPGSSKKRSRRPSAIAAARALAEQEEEAEDEAPSADAELLQAQQREALKMQETSKDEEEGPQRIGKRNCIICLENYTNATVATCGHVYCHECLSRALIASERNNDRSGGKGACPTCRKPLNRKSTKDMIPINFLKKSAFKTKGRQPHNR